MRFAVDDAPWAADEVAAEALEAGLDALADRMRPTNMGFGVSYALPVITAGLLAPAGSLLVVENPEAHLHPAGQSRVGRFLAHLAASGVQVVAETHSDHVLNGVRLAAVEATRARKCPMADWPDGWRCASGFSTTRREPAGASRPAVMTGRA